MTRSLRDIYGYLPVHLGLILEQLGEDVMLRLVAGCGGLRVYFKRLGPDHELVKALGFDDAQRVAAVWTHAGLTQVDVPVMGHALARRRRARLLSLRQSGVKVSDIARQLGLTERGVYDALAQARDGAPDPNQLALL